MFWEQYTELVKTTFKGRGLDWTDLSDLPMRVPECVCTSDYWHMETVADMIAGEMSTTATQTA